MKSEWLPLASAVHVALPSHPSYPLRRKLNSLALSKHTQLLEVLEIPQASQHQHTSDEVFAIVIDVVTFDPR